jgi:hypothetical protein
MPWHYRECLRAERRTRGGSQWAGTLFWQRVSATWRAEKQHPADVHLAGVYARNPLAMPISSSQLISRRVAAAGLGLGRVLYLAADALLAVEGGEVGNGRRRGLGVGRWAHIRGSEALEGWSRGGSTLGCSSWSVEEQRGRG